MPKYWLPSTGTAPISPSKHSSWDRSAHQFGRNKAVTTKINSATTNKGDTSTVSGIQATCAYQWVYGPIAAGTITGTCGLGVRGDTLNFTNIYRAAAVAWIAKPDGTLRGTLFSVDVDNVDMSTVASTAYTWTATCSSVTATAGDYLVLELGWNDSTFTDFEQGRIEIGDGNSETYPYFDFSDTDLAFQAPSGLTYGSTTVRIKRGKAIATNSPSSTGGPIASYAVQTGSLPPGVSLNSTTGAITGTPTATGLYTFTIRGTNEGGTTDSGTITYTVFSVNSLNLNEISKGSLKL